MPHRHPTLHRKWLVLALAGGGLLLVWWLSQSLLWQWIGRTPYELSRYAQHRLEGHPKLEWLAKPWLQRIQAAIEPGDLPLLRPLDVGQQSQSYGVQAYGADGVPLPASRSAAGATPASVGVAGRWRRVASDRELIDALMGAKAGDVIVVASGRYHLANSLHLAGVGRADAPITVRGEQAGSVQISSLGAEGLHIQGPYWVIEDLNIRGACDVHAYCDHAIHVVGRASHVVIRNNVLEDFNAHIKVNGQAGQWPDHGLIQGNTLRNATPRNTSNSVTPIDIVGASDWRVIDNVIANFVKLQGNQVAYGAFMKGGGRNGLFQGNLVYCSTGLVDVRGHTVGLSFGGGGTDAGVCRRKPCDIEHEAGRMVDNRVSRCNDAGIYVNRSTRADIEGNTLMGTLGVDVRFPISSASVHDNVFGGLIRARDGAALEVHDNLERRE